ncbi:esterase-like activity of phytase family protein [Ancylobacter defluvii]|uniref:Alkaline phosphatase n=1 Tax=Ancylobacter defluvii TaxID=1282440 RepID=A0A9W6JZZ0_9HYPH|nr:esterase-like activity of phytase family protein [Ancylobacter defluvii]MBS7586962.1 esterase-like activity of phytase family protein [Ancylobacter defluvii]GLK86267.1 alkaline phosphatase [Ancylobacter defluvii]
MRSTLMAGVCLAMLASAGVAPAQNAPESFNRIATFNVVDNLPAGADAKKSTAAEIITVTEDGSTLIYSDSPGKRIGFIDITDPAAPKPAGTVALDGEPTTTVVIGGKAYVGVNTSESKSNPSGHLAVVDIASRKVEDKVDLGGQPDSVTKSPDGRFLAIAIENERDEDINDGAIPQMPAGNLTTFEVKDGRVVDASKKVVDLTGLAAVAPEDPEPEYVDINARNEVVVTLQENNHIVVVDLPTGKVTAHFSAGTVDLDKIDTKKDGVIDLSGKMTAVPREPDTVQWIDDNRFVIANEGDWKGGTRGFSIFDKTGKLLFESGTAPEHMAVRLGHYPEKRNKKGIEMEGAEVATFGGEKLIFAGSERASLVFVYRDKGGAEAPELLQVLPGGVGPEGLLAIPARNLFVTASETDLREDGGIGSVVTVYQRAPGAPSYPTIVSADDKNGLPIWWGALSGFAADPKDAGKLYAVTDSFYAQGRILTIDATAKPARITAATVVTRDGQPAKGLDLEGIAIRPEGGFWLASEGNPEKKENPTQNLLIRVNADGSIAEEIALPQALAAQATRYGFEGVAVTGTGADETVWLGVQREWKDDPRGFVKLIAYKPATKGFGAVHYPLEKSEKGWVGISELTAHKDGLIVIERDNLVGPDAKLKKLYFVSLKDVVPAAIGSEAKPPVLAKTEVKDLKPLLAAPKGYVLDKVESFAIDAAGNGFIVTDNDGIDGSSGETQFIPLGAIN